MPDILTWSRSEPAAPLAILAILLVILTGSAAAGQPAGVEPEPRDLAVPGGVPGLARALGIREDLPRAQLMLTAIRVLWEAPEGVDAASDRRRGQALDYLARMGAGAPGSPGAGDTVPAFLPLETWSTVLRDVGARQAASPLEGILGSRRAALLYHGVASLDRSTRGYLVAHPALLRQFLDGDRPAIFSSFGRSLHVRDGRVEVPGGTDALPLWESLAGRPTGEPGAFMLRVISKDGGRLALLFDGIGHLDERARRFALGAQLPASERLERFRAFYEASGAALAKWEPGKRPFERIPYDAVHLLLAMQAGVRGEPSGPPWPGFWKAVFNPLVIPDRTELNKGDLDAGGPMDAARLVELVSVGDPAACRERSETWLFANRVFSDPPVSSVPDLLVVLKGRARYPSLLLTLERMGVTSPATYAAATRVARQLSGADRRLWQFQAALAILERARAARSIDASAADALVRSLCGVTPEGGDEYRGAVARWLQRDFLGVVAETLLPAGLRATDRPLETRVLAAMAGSVKSPSNGGLVAVPPLEWEGLTYRVDPGGSTLRRLVEVRARQGGRSLDAVLRLSGLADAIASATSSAEARAAGARLREAGVALQQAPGDAARGSDVAGELPRLDRLIDEAMERVRKLGAAPDARSLAKIARPLQEAVDRYVVDVLGSIAYAPHLGEPDGPALLGGDPARVHEFRFFKPGTELGRRTAWELPAEVRDGEVGWRVSGSLLGLDLALGRLSLRRISHERIPEAPRLSDAVRQAFTESALLISPFDLTEVDRALLLAAVDRGRQRLLALHAAPADTEQVTEAAELDEWRIQAVRWTMVHDPASRLEFFSLGELARLGGLDTASFTTLDAWGTSGFSRDQGLATIYPVHLPWTTISGRRGLRAVEALVPDLTIGLAESSARLGLPASLTAGMLLVATQEFIDTLQTAHEDDWLAMVVHAQSVARSRVEDYVAGLTISGPLVPEQKQPDAQLLFNGRAQQDNQERRWGRGGRTFDTIVQR